MRYATDDPTAFFDWAIMFPHDTSGGVTPKPRNDSVDSMRMAPPTISVVLTMIGPTVFGSMWRKMMRGVEHPMARAASTNSFSLSDRNTPRITRAIVVQKRKERMRM